MGSMKCVVVGDKASDKYDLLLSFINTAFPKACLQYLDESYMVTIMVDSEPINLILWNTTGQEDFDRLRPLSYPCTDVFIICFSISDPASYDNVKLKWYPEVSHNCPNAPFLLVGTKMEEREDPQFVKNLKKQKLTLITRQQGEALAQEIRAIKYLECSVLMQVGVREVFVEAVCAALYANASPVPPKKSCMLL